jgi:hypothetical protein
MTRAQAEYAIGQMERQAGMPAPASAPAAAPKRTTAYAYPGKKKTVSTYAP